MLIIYLGNKITSDQKLHQVKVLHGKHTPRFTCAIPTGVNRRPLLRKPRNAPGQQPCLTSQDPEPTLRTSTQADNEPADHTAGARYVQRAKDTSYLDQNLLESREVSSSCSTASLQSTPTSPPTEPCEASGAGTILSYSWKTLYLAHYPRSTLQPRFPFVSSSSLPIALEPMPWEGPRRAQEAHTLL